LIAIGALAAVQSFDGFGLHGSNEKERECWAVVYPFGKSSSRAVAVSCWVFHLPGAATDQINLAVTLFQRAATPPILKCSTAIPLSDLIDLAILWDGHPMAIHQLDRRRHPPLPAASLSPRNERARPSEVSQPTPSRRTTDLRTAIHLSVCVRESVDQPRTLHIYALATDPLNRSETLPAARR